MIKRSIPVILVLFLGLTTAIHAEMTLVSSYPSHGDVNVPIDTTLIFTFSEPIDLNAQFSDFFLELEIDPEDKMGEPDSLVVSNDLKSIRIYNLHLQRKTLLKSYLQWVIQYGM